MKLLEDNSIDSIVTDPPYELGFMGKKWDNTGIAYNIELWKECLRVLKPGGHLLAFGGTRTYHRMVCAIEDAGFEIRDQIQWIYGSGFPKSRNISKDLDIEVPAASGRKAISKRERIKIENDMLSQWHVQNGLRKDQQSLHLAEKGELTTTSDVPVSKEAKQWYGWGTALKPANEPIVIARKPLSEKTVAKNIVKWGTGGINIDDCRIEFSNNDDPRIGKNYQHNAKAGLENGNKKDNADGEPIQLHKNNGRWPSNVILDEEAGKLLDKQSGIKNTTRHMSYKRSGGEFIDSIPSQPEKDWFAQEKGGASRFFYCAKASKKEKGEFNNHPTVKPLSLIKYLITLVTPPEGVCLDPFEGSGTHVIACQELNIKYIGFEKDIKYCSIIEKRLQNIDNKVL